MFFERVTGAGKTSDLAVCTPVVKTNWEAKIIPHIIQEKLQTAKNKINLHQPSIATTGTSPTVMHIRHVHVATENNALPRSFLSPMPHGPIHSTCSKVFNLANASIEVTTNQWSLSILNGIAQTKAQKCIHMFDFIIHGPRSWKIASKQNQPFPANTK